MPNIRDLGLYPDDVTPDDLTIISREDTDFAYKIPVSEFALPKQSGFSAYLTAPQVETTVNNTIIFNYKLWDYNNEYNISTGTFTPESSGLYYFEAKVGFGTILFDEAFFQIHIGVSFNEVPAPPIPKRKFYTTFLVDNLTVKRYYSLSWVAEIDAGDNIVTEFSCGLLEPATVMGNIDPYAVDVSTFTGIRVG